MRPLAPVIAVNLALNVRAASGCLSRCSTSSSRGLGRVSPVLMRCNSSPKELHHQGSPYDSANGRWLLLTSERNVLAWMPRVWPGPIMAPWEMSRSLGSPIQDNDAQFALPVVGGCLRAVS